MIVAKNINVPNRIKELALSEANRISESSDYGDVETSHFRRVEGIGSANIGAVEGIGKAQLVAVKGICFPHVDDFWPKGTHWVTLCLADGWWFGDVRKVRRDGKPGWSDNLSVLTRPGDVFVVSAHRPHWLLPASPSVNNLVWHGLQWECHGDGEATEIVQRIRSAWGHA